MSDSLAPDDVKPLLRGRFGDVYRYAEITGSTQQMLAALLYANFLMSDQVQIDKLEQTGSRTARLDLQTAGKIPDRPAVYLVPDQLYHERTRPRINGLISDAAADIFVAQVLAQ